MSTPNQPTQAPDPAQSKCEPPVAQPAETPTPQVAPTPTPAPNASAGRLHAPPLGTRIQVLWRIETDPEEGAADSAPTVQEKWWGAVVQDCTNTPAGSAVKAEYASQSVFILLYDPWGEFEDETTRVVFIPDGTLIVLARVLEDDQGLLDWRIEGDESAADTQMTLAEVANEHDAMVEEAGISTDADLQALSQMPADVQLHMTAGYRVFADGVKEMLRELVANKPPGYVVTESDVQTIYARVRERGAQVNVRM